MVARFSIPRSEKGARMVLPLRDIQPRSTFPFVTIAFIVINFALFFYELSLGPDLGRFFAEHAFIPATFFEAGALAAVPSMFLSMFLHGGWAHLLGNMLYLWIFGDNIEDRLGHGRYILFFVGCGLAATLAHAYSNPGSVVPSIGASGAIAGVLGAYLVIFPKARVLTLIPLGFFLRVAELPALIVLGLWFVMQIFSGFASLSAQTAQSAGVAWWAHIGGFVIGLAVGMIVRMQGPPGRPPLRSARHSWFGMLLVLCMLVTLLPQRGWSEAKVLIPDQQHDKMTVELHSIGDEVLFYIGDPQAFLALTARPGSIPPHVDFTNSGRSVMLRILDQTLLEDLNPAEQEYLDGDIGNERWNEIVPEEQRWDVRLSPASPGTFLLHVENGAGTFDFTDMEIKDVYLLGDSSRIEVQFDRPNLIPLERFTITMTGGELKFSGMLNARAKSVTLQIPRTQCEIELLGKPFEGTSEIFFENVPKSLRITLSRKVGVRISGLAENVVRFDRKGMLRDGRSLLTANYADNKCKIQLHFSEAIPNMEVDWD